MPFLEFEAVEAAFSLRQTSPPSIGRFTGTEQLLRQVFHWQNAVQRLSNLRNLTSELGWQSIEPSLGAELQHQLTQSINQLQAQGSLVQSAIEQAQSPDQIEAARKQLLAFRNQYLQTETTVHFFTDAVNTRTSPQIATLLRACDAMCRQSMVEILPALGKPIPHVLTYVDKGLGASILKAGLKLWDFRTVSPTAAIKVTYHNLLRPTALIHETGHQVAHQLDWNDQLAQVFREKLAPHSAELAAAWAVWSSEIAADAFAFVHTGFAGVAALHDVLAGNEHFVFNYSPNDPHPISYLRLLLNTAWCRLYFGAGAWDAMEQSWRNAYNAAAYPHSDQQLIAISEKLMPMIAQLVTEIPLPAFNNRSLIQILPPHRVAPAQLEQWAATHESTILNQTEQLKRDCLRLLALTGTRIGSRPDWIQHGFRFQEQWTGILGQAPQTSLLRGD
ncbi:MAG: hypothetical protein RL757_2458 [Bacteroidota bacterium]|jgi:hypothetical protein